MRYLVILNFLFLSFTGIADESAFDSTDYQATDQEEAAAENYIHEGIASEQTTEWCSDGVGGYSDICTEDSNAFSSSGSKTLENLLPALTTAYSMFNSAISAQGGGLTATSEVATKDTAGNIVKDSNGNTVMETKEESKPDYCGYIGLAGEAASTAYTTIQNNKTQSTYESENPESIQAASFYALADSHKTLKTAATVQAGIWGATAACYVAYAVQASYSGDWKVYAKMAAASFIALFYKKKADAHKERYEILIQMAKDLPQAGECNPYTNKSCFCAEESSAVSDPTNYVKLCEPSTIASNSDDTDSYSYVCTDSSGNADEDCSCANSDSCTSKTVLAAANSLGLDPTALKSSLSAIKAIDDGFVDGSVAAANTANAALVKKTLDSFKPTSSVDLTDDQKAVAATLSENGISKAAAAYLAKSNNGNSSALPANATGGITKSSLKLPAKKTVPKKANSLASAQFTSGGSIKSGRSSNSRSALLNRLKNRNKASSGNTIEIEGYAEKAAREAEIVKDTSKGIFEIISYRYKMRAWKEFSESMKTSK